MDNNCQIDTDRSLDVYLLTVDVASYDVSQTNTHLVPYPHATNFYGNYAATSVTYSIGATITDGYPLDAAQPYHLAEHGLLFKQGAYATAGTSFSIVTPGFFQVEAWVRPDQ